MTRRLLATNARAATVLVRFIVGAIFFTEGIQKFLYPADLGEGRFAKIGIPFPEITGPFVGGVETICGALVILGLLTRLASILLLIDISVAIVSTKIPVLLGYGFWAFALPKLPRYGFLSMVHEGRADFAMWFGLLFLLIVGAGKFSYVIGGFSFAIGCRNRNRIVPTIEVTNNYLIILNCSEREA